MPRYFFNLRDGASGFRDPEGVLLKNGDAATAYATRVARELMSHCEKQRRHWQLDVWDEGGNHVLRLPFATIDRTLDILIKPTRRLVERWCEDRLELEEALSAARETAQQSRALIARSRGKPYLVAAKGERIGSDG